MSAVDTEAEQRPLFDLPPGPDPDYVLRVVKIPARPWRPALVSPDPRARIESRLDIKFWEAMEANPDLYVAFVRLARDLKSRGYRRIGAKMLIEVLRWQHLVRTSDPASEFRLNNNWTSRLARLAMSNESDLDGLFDLRELRS